MKTEKIILILILFLSLSINAQTIEEIQAQIRALIQIQTGFDYYVYVKKAVSEEFADENFSDPNNLLEDCYLFLTRSAPMDDGTSQNSFIGIFKNNNIIWQSPHVIDADNSWGFYFGYVIDMNKDQSIEIISIWLQGMSAYSEDVWVASWNGTTGQFVNEYLPNGRSEINIVTGSMKIVDVEGDGIFEIEGIALEGEEELKKIYSWNIGVIGDFGVEVPQVYPRNRVKGNVKAIITKQNDLFSYKYIIVDSVNSNQSIELFAIDCNISTQSATQVPQGWDFTNIYDRNLLCWNYNIIASSNYYNYLINPGEIEDNFLIVSDYLPTITKYYLQGNNGDVSINIDELFYNTSIGFTLTPTMIDSIEPLSFLDTLLTYNHRSSQLGWIINQPTADKYDSLLTLAKTQLQQNNNNAARVALQTILQQVDIDSTDNLTSEAYALLRYNTEYLLEKIPQSSPNLLVKLTSSQGTQIPASNVQYYEGSWKDAVNNGDGTFTVITTKPKVSIRVYYEYASLQADNVPAQNNTYTFQTVKCTIQLKNSLGNLIDQGTVQYYAGAWRSFGTTSGGVATKELLPINYSFRMTYEYGSIDKQQNLSVDPTVVFQTVNAVVQLKNSLGNLIDQGTVQYYAGAWRSFGTTLNGVATKELLPVNYSFRMTYEFASIDKQQNLSVDPTVVFQAVNAQVQLKNSQGAFIDTGTVQYYAGAWRSFGTTLNGVATKELLPVNYSFRMTYEYVSKDKQQNLSTNPVVDFNTVLCSVKVSKTSNNEPIANAAVKYYAGAWRNLGTTNSDGITTKELLPANLSFRATLGNVSADKQQDISVNNLVEILLNIP